MEDIRSRALDHAYSTEALRFIVAEWVLPHCVFHPQRLAVDGRQCEACVEAEDNARSGGW